MRRLAWLCLLLLGCQEPILKLPDPTAQTGERPVWIDQSRPRGEPARAFVIERTADLLPGAQATGKLGDVRLDNGRVAFIVDGVGSSYGFAESGGNLVDAAPRSGEDALTQIIGCLDASFPRQPIYDTVEPQQRNEVALVRASGHDSADPDLAVETEYALRPGSNALEITTRVTNRSQKALQRYEVGDAIEWGRSERFVPGPGLVQPPHGTDEIKAGFVEALGDKVTYGYVVDSGPLKARHGVTWSDTDVAVADLAPSASVTAHRWLIVGDAAGTEVAEAIALLRKEAWARLDGHVTAEGTNRRLADAAVVLSEAGGRAVAVARSTADGYSLLAPPGDYRLRAFAAGRRGVDVEVDLREGKGYLDVLLSRPGAVTVEVNEAGARVPAKLTFVPLEADPTAFHLGPAYANPGGAVALTATGEARLMIPPGRYRVIASRGPFDSIDVQEVEVPSGSGHGPRLTFNLERAVDVRGWLCVDPDQHAEASADSAVSERDRLVSNLAEGLDAMVATDHAAVADWKPAQASIEAARPLELIVGEEAGREGVGHFGAWPVERHGGEPRGGAVDARGKTPRELIDALREGGGDRRVIVVHHPREGGAGYFNTIKLDPRAETLPPGWDDRFDAIEVFSGQDPSSTEAPLRDWFALLDRGLPFTAVGGSGSHAIWGEEVGYPRTCVPPPAPSSASSETRVTDALVAALKHRREVLVTNGPFVRVSVGGRGMGQLAPAPTGKARLEVDVLAAPWIDVRHLEVVVNGDRRGKPIEIPASRSALRFHGSIDLKLAEDSYVVVLVRGDQPLDPVLPRWSGSPPATPLAITNPIYLDRDLDGKFTPPRARK